MKMKIGTMSKRDEAVAPVREGSVVFGASRYDSSLRCTRRRTQRLRRRTLHLTTFLKVVSARSGADPSSQQTSESRRRTRSRPTWNGCVSRACVAAAVVRRL